MKINKIKRLANIISIFGKFYYSNYLSKTGNNISITKKAKALKNAIEQSGFMFIKLGQFLSMRPDVVSIKYCIELFGLLENVNSFNFQYTKKVIKEDLGLNVKNDFKNFSEIPVASASMGQVYKVITKKGDVIAMKIKRPNIEQLIQIDLTIIKLLAIIISLLTLNKINLKNKINEFKIWLKDELNYKKELKNTKEFYNEFKKHKEGIFCPKVHEDLSSDRIISFEFIEGYSLNKILNAYRDNNKKLIRNIEKNGFNRKSVGRDVLKVLGRQLYHENIFHADPHPANLIFTSEGKIACIDFGIVGKVDKKFKLLYLRYIRLGLTGNLDAFDTILKIIDTSKVKDLEKLRQDHNNTLLKNYKIILKKKESDNIKHFIGILLVNAVNVVNKHNAIIPLSLLKFLRAITMLESLFFYINPDDNIDYLINFIKNESIGAIVGELIKGNSKEIIKNIFIDEVINKIENSILKTNY